MKIAEFYFTNDETVNISIMYLISKLIFLFLTFALICAMLKDACVNKILFMYAIYIEKVHISSLKTQCFTPFKISLTKQFEKVMLKIDFKFGKLTANSML